MAASFSVTRRFFDDKNYPRGFSRHGDYTIKESQVLEQYGQAFKALDLGEHAAETFFEKTWNKYRTRINTKKRVYTLSGDVSEAASGSEDYSGE